MQRYTDIPFPPYTFIPGQTPHPTRDPQGHSYGQEHVEHIAFSQEAWEQCQSYLYGIDLFNHDYWWEAHEALEAVWVAAGRTTKTGYFIQGLIQIAVAQLKQHQGYSDVAQRMAADGLDNMHLLSGTFLGIELNELRRQVDRFISEPGNNRISITLSLPYVQET